MKYILLLRHAKSSWEDSSLKDFDRPLAERGEKDAPRMGKFLKQVEYLPARIIASPALRAKQTTTLFAEAAALDEDLITWNEDLYYGSYKDYLSAIKNTSDDIKTIMLVGHNPKMEEMADVLCNDEDTGAIRIPTAALLCFEHHADRWKRVQPGTAQLKWMMIPKVVKRLKGY